MSDLMPDTCPLISEIGPAREAEILRLHDAGMGPVKLGARFRLAYAKINAIVARELAQRATGGTLEWHRWQHLPVEQKLDWHWAPRENRFVRHYDPLANAEAAAREFERKMSEDAPNASEGNAHNRFFTSALEPVTASGSQYIASDYIAWRWIDTNIKDGDGTKPSGDTHGYCGLAGNPE